MLRWQQGRVLLGLIVLLVLTFIASLAIGSVSISPARLWGIMRGDHQQLASTLVLQLRLPRALNAIAVGGLLGLSGTLMQVLLRNPLADPYILGVSGGASLGALGAMLLGVGGIFLSFSTFGGALVSIFLVFVLAQKGMQWSSSRLLLTGVVMASGWGALIVLMLSLAPSDQLPGMLFWLMGDLGYAGSPWPGLVILCAVTLAVLPLGRSLNLLSRGTLQAMALGVSVRSLGWVLYVLASLLTSVAVMSAGSIGFIGLITPHVLRLLFGNDHRLLLPASALFGAILLLISDTLARTVIAPEQLPVGVITVLLGVPVFIFLLRREGRS